MTSKKRGLSTRCVQGIGVQHEGPAVVPIVQTSTFVFKDQQEILDSVLGKSDKDLYTRWGNPTTRNVENKISSLEGTEDSIVLSSGMAAISSAILGLIRSGGRILSTDSIYGGTMKLFHKLQNEFSIEIDFVDCNEFVDAIQESNGRHQLCYFETPTNPTLKIVDIKGVSDAAQSAGMLSMIDSTFGSPINQRPHEMGVDIVMHSATKYLGGHSDIIAGSVSTSSELMAKIRGAAKLLGGTMDPFASFLLDRGLKTLQIRMERHNHNAMYLAAKLAEDGRIIRVHYPGLPDHPNHSVARRQMSGYGGMLAVDLDCCLEDANAFVDALQLFLNAVSLGSVESLASIPAMTTHYGLSDDELAEMGISPSTVRMSIGIEDVEDLHTDIIDALDMIP
ncbi:MAG: trans-sulfuration enzyme family protein [Promethearchaeota archaeon]